ncbi:peptidoglycan bridge formation glycyltransferase FemA/FemB family protein [Kocuria sediminis]|uniref:Peptidoglycan bridge formation glycyltransferase FemA/FemB family protein n=1 Tax=Kocuria sediminis TaxID=1038857 RepID=A0A6N8GPJ7_9MICC|nr:peptidoglycan bridge formation glycyltransferase FemA/FemB family protein [Kocuria sediminis]
MFEASGDGWRYVAIRMGGNTWPYLYCPDGPEATTPSAFEFALSHLTRTAREHKCWFIRIEPDAIAITDGPESPEDSLRRRGFRRSPHQERPSYTRIIDLTQDVSSILQDMDATNRTLYRNIHKKGVTFTASRDPDDLRILLPFYDAVAAHGGFARRNDEYLRSQAQTMMPLGMAILYVAWLNENPIGAMLVFDTNDTRSYVHSAMDFEHRKLNAGKPLLVRIILDAKAKGLTKFDFWGSAPPNAGPEHKWYGFSQFKKTFGGHLVHAPGAWDLPLLPGRYGVYGVACAFRKQIHRDVQVRNERPRIKRP